ncbi:MAG: TIGR02117 family protein [Bacteroidia bacterium]|nr:TIGR02117 family protein [Bacteroidia bacterium]
MIKYQLKNSLLIKLVKAYVYSLLLLFLLLIISSFIPVGETASGGSDPISIFIADNGIHIDIIVPVRTKDCNWNDKLDVKQFWESNIECNYLAFGWGDRDFYINTPTSENWSFWFTIKALAWPTLSVMHVQGYYKMTKSGNIKEVKISKSNYLKLTAFILKSFKADNQGNFQFANKGYNHNDAFFEANGNYTAFNTCNSWVKDALKEAKVKTPLWAGLSSAIMYHLE